MTNRFLTAADDSDYAVASRPTSLFSSTNWVAENVAPCGSRITVSREYGASTGGCNHGAAEFHRLRRSRIGVISGEGDAPLGGLV